MFIDDEDSDSISEGPNTIHLRRHLDFGGQTLIESVAGAAAAGNSNANVIGTLMQVYITKWDGPAFLDKNGRAVPVSAAQIRRLDPNDPLVERVHDEIARRYGESQKKSPDPNSPTANGSTSAG